MRSVFLKTWYSVVFYNQFKLYAMLYRSVYFCLQSNKRVLNHSELISRGYIQSYSRHGYLKVVVLKSDHEVRADGQHHTIKHLRLEDSASFCTALLDFTTLLLFPDQMPVLLLTYFFNKQYWIKSFDRSK